MRKTAILIILTSLCGIALKAQDQASTAARPDCAAQAPSTGSAPAAPAIGTGTSQVPIPAPITGDTAIALARKYVDVWNSGDKSAIDSIPAFIMHNHGGRVLVGPDMLARVVANWRRSMPDLTFTIDDTVVQVDKVVFRVTLRGTYKERLFPEAGEPQTPPRLVRATGIFIFKVGEGKIQEIWQELDESILKVQMGAQWKTRQERAGDSAPSSESNKQEKAPAGIPPPKP